MKRLEAAFKPESKYRAFFLSIITFGLAYGLYCSQFCTFFKRIESILPIMIF